MNRKATKLIFILAFMLMISGTAKAEIFFAYLNSAQEVPTNASTGRGYARVVLNESALTVTWTVVFTGLQGNQTASHIHAPAPIGTNAGVIINFPAAGGTSGTLTFKSVSLGSGSASNSSTTRLAT